MSAAHVIEFDTGRDGRVDVSFERGAQAAARAIENVYSECFEEPNFVLVEEERFAKYRVDLRVSLVFTFVRDE